MPKRIIVKKFGGTSVGTIDRILNVASLIAKSAKNRDDAVVVVVSAMAGMTNDLVKLIDKVGCVEGTPTYDFVVSSGEQISAGTLCGALQNLGIKAKAYCGWQLKIKTNKTYGRATIEDIDVSQIISDIENGYVPVICGFQGVTDENKITTLGRGGSDLTAVSLSAYLHAEVCEIYSDVDGVYTADPNMIVGARLLDGLCYDEMLELSNSGAKVLQAQSVEFAKKSNVNVRVVSSFIDCHGTLISSNENANHYMIAILEDLAHFSMDSCLDDYDEVMHAFARQYVAVDVWKHDGQMVISVPHKEIRDTLQKYSEIIYSERCKRIMFKQPSSKISVIKKNIIDCKDVVDDVLSSIFNNEEILFSTIAQNRISIIVPSSGILEIAQKLHDCFYQKIDL